MRRGLVMFAAVLVALAWLNPPSSSAVRPIGPVVLSAVVNVDGTLARGVGAVASEAVGTDGVYFVTFNRDVSNCAYVGAGGEATTFPPDDSITIGASASDRGNPNEVGIIEWDGILGVDSYSSGFHLIVVCPPAATP